MNERNIILKLNSFEAGALMGLILRLDEKKGQALSEVKKQLVEIKREFEKDAGVRKEVLPGGLLQITDRSGTVIIRQPYPFEVEGN